VPVISSDAVRKEMAGKSGRQSVPFNAGIYSRTMTEKTYKKMAREAGKHILSKNGVILDATFGQKMQREPIIRLAERYQVPLFLIHCSASEETTRNRLTQRAFEGKDISDGRWEIYLEQAAAYQPIDEISSDRHLELNTEMPVEQLAQASERFLRSRRELQA